MNGIVHPCTHPEGKPAPETEEDMMLEIFSYTERVVAMIRPRKLLFMAIGAFYFLSTLALNSFTPLGFLLRSKAETDSLDVLVGCDHQTELRREPK